jgi:LAS superfamily LD-carboxypeptidase LdcB
VQLEPITDLSIKKSELAISHPHLYGLDEANLVKFESVLLQQETAKAFAAMRDAAKRQGINIAICSAYRSFDKQLSIWNAKATGKRPLLDKQHQPLNFESLSSQQIIDSILIWSALPGASRHHWGTDIDVYDPSKIDRDALQLVAAEYQANGPCHALYLWLQQHANQFGFYFPFQQGKSGVSTEEWHLSYYPVASHYTESYLCQDLYKVFEYAEFELKSPVMARLDELVNHYVKFVASVPI